MFLVTLVQKIHQRRYWSPRRLGSVLWSIAGNLRGQMELLRIFSLPAFRSLVLLDPVVPFRHHNPKFLFPGLSANARAASMLHHYRFATSHLPNRILHQSGNWEIQVMDQQKSGLNFAVTLGPPPEHALWEGESLLQLRVDGVAIYELQFTIVPGWVLNSKQQDVVFIQRVQGMKGCFEPVKAASKAFGYISPPLLLVAALEGIAAGWGIREMACISANSQYCNRKSFEDIDWSALSKRVYDEFFSELGATRVSADFFSLPLPIEGKPIEAVEGRHRAAARKKRAVRHEIANHACQRILEAAAEPQPVRRLSSESQDSRELPAAGQSSQSGLQWKGSRACATGEKLLR